MKDILNKTERVLKLGTYSSKTHKAYLLYIKEYVRFSKKAGIKNKQKAIEDFLLDKYKRKQSPQKTKPMVGALRRQRKSPPKEVDKFYILVPGVGLEPTRL